MSEPIRLEYDTQSDSISSEEVRMSEQSFLLPSVLRGAAYISSGGRIYRLFSDSDVVSLPAAPIGEMFRFEPLPEQQPLENSSLPNEIMSESSIESLPESPPESLKESLAKLFASEEKTLPILSIKRPPAETESTLRSETDSISTLYATKNSVTTKKNIHKLSTGSSATATSKTVSALKLFETVSKAAPHETVSVNLVRKNLPQSNPSTMEPLPTATVPFSHTNSTVSTVTEKEAETVVNPPVTKFIRLKIQQPRKQKRPFSVRELPLLQQEKPELKLSVPDREPDRVSKIESVPYYQEPVVLPTQSIKRDENIVTNVTKIAETAAMTTETVTVETVVTKTLTETLTETLINKSVDCLSDSVSNSISNNEDSVTKQADVKTDITFINTSSHAVPPLIFPQQVSTPHLSPLLMPQQEQRTWRLTWQPHWPEHLQSLELAASDQICFLADHLEMLHKRGCKTISFNSFRPGDGCTTLALCAARELAERGYRLLLADAHQRNPELPKLLRLNTDPHLYEIITLIQDHLELLPWTATSIEIASTNVIYTQSFGEIVGSFRNDYDFILLDNGSLIEFPLAERVMLWRDMCSDGVLLVLNMKAPAPVNVQDITRRLHQYRVELLGVAENYV